jgi:hypothetical protein
MSTKFGIVALAGAFLLAGCGSFAPNSDVLVGIHTGHIERPAIPDNQSVKLVRREPPPAAGGKDVSGTSCKNKLWESEPSEDNAIALMMRQAAEMGMDVIYVAKVGNDPAALAMNC